MMKKMLMLSVAALAFSAFAFPKSAGAQEVTVYADEAPLPPAVYVDPIPPVVIAGIDPIYYGGRPTYWYNNHWYYRDGGRWTFYGREPRGLYERRGRGLPAAHYHGGGGGWGHRR